jgi:cytoskeletal protein CcmA (bactofilin family)
MSRPPEGTIGPQLLVQGRLRGKADLAVEGGIDGDVDLEGALVVAPGGSITGAVRATSVEVAGEIAGDVHGRREVIVRPSGRIQGDVKTSCLVLDDGALLDGMVETVTEEGA